METDIFQTDCKSIKLNKQTCKKIKKLIEEEESEKIKVEEFIFNGKIIPNREDFFSLLVKEIQKLKVEDDFINMNLKYNRAREKRSEHSRCLKKKRGYIIK